MHYGEGTLYHYWGAVTTYTSRNWTWSSNANDQVGVKKCDPDSLSNGDVDTVQPGGSRELDNACVRMVRCSYTSSNYFELYFLGKISSSDGVLLATWKKPWVWLMKNMSFDICAVDRKYLTVGFLMFPLPTPNSICTTCYSLYKSPVVFKNARFLWSSWYCDFIVDNWNHALVCHEEVNLLHD